MKVYKNVLIEYKKNTIMIKIIYMVLNLQRACEVTIDIAMYIISTRKLGIPQTKKEAFVKLEEHNIIPKELSTKLQKMIGFRNIAVHDYKQIDEDILSDVIENHLDDLITFAKIILNLKR